MSHATAERIHFPNGLAIDLDLAWEKLIERQFAGDAGRAFGELIQNLLDSFPSNVPLGDRRGRITTGDHRISIEDYGEGMDRARLRLLTTLGGTDKRNDATKIGRFGLGFFSVFNTALGTKQVTVRTICEGYPVEVRFDVSKPGKRPSIQHRFLTGGLDYSTRIEVCFDKLSSVPKCVEWARKALEYYPCTVTIDDVAVSTAWQKAVERGYEIWTDGACQGFIEPSYSSSVVILCKFEHLSTFSMGNLSTGGHGMNYDLRDLGRREIPYIPRKRVVINCNDLDVPVGRNGFRMDFAFDRMVKTIAHQVGSSLCERLKTPESCESWDQLVVANQYILSGELRHFLDGEYHKYTCVQSPDLLELLANAQVYPLGNHEGLFSLADLRRMKSDDLPLFYSPDGVNPRWLGGNFLNDFVVIPPTCRIGGGAPDLYGSLFERVFGDAVNLDGIEGDQATIAKLAERGIVDRDILAPKTGIIDEPDLEATFVELLEEINALLGDDAIRDTVRESLKIPAESITASYFAVDKDNVTVPTALLERGGAAFNPTAKALQPQDLVLGLQLRHPLIRALAASSNPHRAYYAMTYLCGELVKCQRILIPYSRPFNRLRRDLTRRVRNVLIDRFVRVELDDGGAGEASGEDCNGGNGTNDDTPEQAIAS